MVCKTFPLKKKLIIFNKIGICLNACCLFSCITIWSKGSLAYFTTNRWVVAEIVIVIFIAENY